MVWPRQPHGRSVRFGHHHHLREPVAQGPPRGAGLGAGRHHLGRQLQQCPVLHREPGRQPVRVPRLHWDERHHPELHRQPEQRRSAAGGGVAHLRHRHHRIRRVPRRVVAARGERRGRGGGGDGHPGHSHALQQLLLPRHLERTALRRGSSRGRRSHAGQGGAVPGLPDRRARRRRDLVGLELPDGRSRHRSLAGRARGARREPSGRPASRRHGGAGERERGRPARGGSGGVRVSRGGVPGLRPDRRRGRGAAARVRADERDRAGDRLRPRPAAVPGRAERGGRVALLRSGAGGRGRLRSAHAPTTRWKSRSRCSTRAPPSRPA